LYPDDPVARNLFAALGTPFATGSEDQFDAMCAATATIASYFGYMDGVASWLARNGISESQARDYVARMFWGVTSVAAGAPEPSFQSLASKHATAGGISELFSRYLVERGILQGVSDGLDVVKNRIRETASGYARAI
jgi:pyrroline-5-carboxylate reductase